MIVSTSVTVSAVSQPSMFSYTTAGTSHTCGLNGGKAYCWGSNTSGQLGNNTVDDSSLVPTAVSTAGVLSGKTVTSISAGGYNTCVIANGKAYCWGNNDGAGELGDGTVSTGRSIVPVAVDTTGVLAGKMITSISVGSNNSCVVASGKAYCWGYGGDGQLGNNSMSNSSVPVAVDTSGVLAGKTITSISAGGAHTCATANGAAYCWGYGGDGQLGNNSMSNSSVPVAVDTSGILAGKTVTSIKTGENSACVLADGNVYCWGYGGDGELGNNSTDDSLVPVAVETVGVLAGKTVTSIKTGGYHSCATTDGTVYCWGYGGDGGLGNNSTDDSLVPVAVETVGVLAGKTVTSIENGGSHTCAVASGKAYCWGYGGDGGLGNNSMSNSLVPVAVDTSGVLAGKTVTDVAVSSEHSCVVANEAAYCWGYNGSGELGNNSTDDSLVPVAVETVGVLAGKTVTSIENGGSHTCAVASGKAYCWGSNGSGMLGNNSTDDSLVPVAVDTTGILAGKTVTDAAAGSGQSCAVADNKAYCWGYGGFADKGMLGNNSTDDSLVPVAVDTSGVLAGKTVTDVAVGDDQSCVVANSKPYCWGGGEEGGLGNGAIGNSPVPVAVETSGVLAGKIVTDVAAGGNYASRGCAVANNKAYCWGYGGDGGLGNNSSTSTDIPTGIYEGIISTFFTVPTLRVAGKPLTSNTTVSSSPSFSGTAEPGYTINVTVHSDPVSCEDTVDSGGEWSCAITNGLPAGHHTVIVTATDLFGGVLTLGPTDIIVASTQNADNSDSTNDSGSPSSAQAPSLKNTSYNTNSYGRENGQSVVGDDSSTLPISDRVPETPKIADKQPAADNTTGATSQWMKLIGLVGATAFVIATLVFIRRRRLAR